jgi:pyruvate/2-oxoglutarate/acetoin dehydrogenase E1 component
MGVAMSETMTYAAAFQRAMIDEMERDETIFVLGTDLYVRGGHFAQVKGLGERFGPARVRDTPISEAAMVAAGVGSAMHGMRPVVDLNFADFAMGAMDEIVNQAAKMRYMFGARVPLVIRGSSGVGLFAAQHTNSVESWFAATPGLVVATPATPADAGGLLVQALRGDDPVIFLMHKRLASVRGEVDLPIQPLPFGKAAIAREGSDVTLITYSFTLRQALEAAEAVESDGISVEVIDLRTVAPLDRETVNESVRKTGRVVLLSDAPTVGGVLAEVAAGIQESVLEYLDAPIVRLGGRHAPIPHSPPLFEALVPSLDSVSAALRDIVGVAV